MAGVALTGLGLGSGLDTDSIVSALAGIERQPQKAMQAKLTATNSSIQNLSSVSSLLAKLKTASDALDTTAEVGSYKATSSNAAVVASAGGLAAPGKYTLQVDQLAKEQRTYSNTIASVGTALGQSGTLSISVGGATATAINIAATDTIDDVMAKVNAAGLRVSASSFYDGSSFRIQLRGLDTGAANAVSITETGTNFGFDVPANTVQAAQDAQLKLDGFTITSSTNQVSGAIRGVTLALTATSVDPVTVAIDTDPDALKTKLTALVDAYNAVVAKVKDLAGTSAGAPKDALLAADSTLRSIQSRLSTALQTVTSNGGNYNTLGSIGLALDRSGKLSLDAGKFSAAMTADASGVAKLLAGSDGGAQGVMKTISSAVDAFTRVDVGLLVTRSAGLTTQTKNLQLRIDREEARVNRYADMLRKQFTDMDKQVAAWNSQSSYLSRLG